MKRVGDRFVLSLGGLVALAKQQVQILEIGCGAGRVSAELAVGAKFVLGIDPDRQKVAQANQLGLSNAHFVCAKAEELPPAIPGGFDVCVVSLALHHIPRERMHDSISAARRRLHRTGTIVFLEPGEDGTFFDAEVQYGACDGDERAAKTAAQHAINTHPGLRVSFSWDDMVEFVCDSVDDFVASMTPTKGSRGEWEDFLHRTQYILTARRRITVCSIVP